MRENEAAQRLAASSAQLSAKEREVEQLRGYLAEYRQRAYNESTDSTRLQNTRAFPLALERRGRVSRGRAAEGGRAPSVRAERWRDSHQRAQALDKIDRALAARRARRATAPRPGRSRRARGAARHARIGSRRLLLLSRLRVDDLHVILGDVALFRRLLRAREPGARLTELLLVEQHDAHRAAAQPPCP